MPRCARLQCYAAMCFDFFLLRLCAKAMVSLNWIDVKKEIQDKEQHRFDTKPPSAPTCVFAQGAL